jgi:hypothetical protein
MQSQARRWSLAALVLSIALVFWHPTLLLLPGIPFLVLLPAWVGHAIEPDGGAPALLAMVVVGALLFWLAVTVLAAAWWWRARKLGAAARG